MSLESILNVFPNKTQFDAMNKSLNLIANKMGAYEEPLTWGAFRSAVRAGNIRDFVDVGSQVNVDHASILNITFNGEAITAATITNKDAFLEHAGTEFHDYEFVFDGAAWHYNEHPVSLTDFGISVTGTPAANDELYVHRTATVYAFDIEGINEEQPADETLEHNVSMLMHNVYTQINFDPPQFLYAVTATDWPNGMPAGTYNITCDRAAYNGGTTQDGTFQFTTTATIPVGGGIRHSAIGVYQSSSYTKAQILAGTFSTYGADTTTTIETGLATTEGNDGTSLGTTTAADPTYKSGNAMNFSQRQAYGSNRWSTSWLRQLLNSADATFVWHPATIWSRNITGTYEGYLHTIDPELRAVLAKTRTRYAKCIADGYGYEDIEDYVTLATMLDIYGSQNNGVYEGPVKADGTVIRKTYTSLWKNATQAEKIKYQGTTARSWWLGGPHPSRASLVRYVHASGALNGGDASYSVGVVPRLTIA